MSVNASFLGPDGVVMLASEGYDGNNWTMMVFPVNVMEFVVMMWLGII